MIPFYAEETVTVAGPVAKLPQKGSGSGGSRRPLNSFVIRRGEGAVLLDAAYSWALTGIAAEPSPQAIVFSHGDTVDSADALDALAGRGAPFLLHPADGREGPVAFEDPRGHPALGGIEVIGMPGHTPGSICLWLAGEGILLTGDAAVAPGPEQEAEPARLQVPIQADVARAQADWRALVPRLGGLRVVAPLHGAIYRRDEMGEAAFDAALAHLWEGEPMDPRSP